LARFGSIAVAGTLLLLPSIAVTQIAWEVHVSGFVRPDDHQTITALAVGAGLPSVARVSEIFPQFSSCPVVMVESERLQSGRRRTWQRVELNDGTRGEDCRRQKFAHAWRVAQEVETLGQWLVEDGSLRAWIHLGWDAPYAEAEQIVLAFMRQTVVDRRPLRPDAIPQDPQLPVGREALKIDYMDNLNAGPNGWLMMADGWHHEVVVQGGRVQVISSSFPIP